MIRLARLARIWGVWSWPVLLVYWPLLACATHWPNLAAPAGTPAGSDKIVHVVAFFILNGLLMHALPGRFRDRRGQRRAYLPTHNDVALATAIILLYGVVDEYTQAMIPGRFFGWDDIVANCAGCLAAAAVISRHAVVRNWAITTLWLSRAVLVISVPFILYATFKTGFNPAMEGHPLRWLYFKSMAWMHAIGHREVTFDKLAHFVLSALLLWLLVAARPLGRRRWVALQNVLWVILLVVAAPVIEHFQEKQDRAVEYRDMIYHFWGLGFGLVMWAMFVALKRTGRKNNIDISQPETDGAFVGHAYAVAILTLLSRITGLVRDSVMASIFGLSSVMSAFTIGFMIPNLFRRLFGEGALTAAFIPIYTETRRKDPLLARKLASLCIALLLVVTSALTVIGEMILAQMSTWETINGNPVTEETTLAIELTYIMLPYMPLVCVSALMGGILQVHRRFGPPAAAPVLLNIIMIAAAWYVSNQTGSTAGRENAVVIVAKSVLIAGVLQLAWQIFAVLRVESFTLRLREAGGALKPVVYMMLPMVIGLAVVQINTLVDTLIAWSLAKPEGGPDTFQMFGRAWEYPIADRGAPAALSFAQRLYQFPLGVFGIALATAIFPALANAAVDRPEGDPRFAGESEFQRILHHGLRLTMFIGLPASVGLIMVRLPLTRIIFEYQKMDLQDSQRIAWILVGYSSGIWAYSMLHVLTRAFYALKDSRTPLKVSMIMVVFNFFLNITLVWVFRESGLAWATAITSVGQAGLLVLLMRKYVPRPLDSTVLASWLRSGTLSVLMAVALAIVLYFFDPATLTRWQSGTLLVAMVALGGLIYLGGAKLTQTPELHWLIQRKTG